MDGSKPQLMISYQWDNKEEVWEISEALKSFGYKVWLDVEQMHGDIYERMAEGVEQSSIILPCLTSKYEKSKNCCRELEFAVVKNKKIIPIHLEENYEAKGAIGLFTAGKLYFNFTSKNKFHANISALKKEIDGQFVCKETESRKQIEIHSRKSNEESLAGIVKDDFQNAKTEETDEGCNNISMQGKDTDNERSEAIKWMHSQSTAECEDDRHRQSNEQNCVNQESTKLRLPCTTLQEARKSSEKQETNPDHLKAQKTKDDREIDHQQVECSHKPDTDYRNCATEEEAVEHVECMERNIVLQNTRVIWKILDVRSHPKNGPIPNIKRSLPSDLIIRDEDHWIVFGRGENVDVYLHDILSSRLHAKFRVTRDTGSATSQRFLAQIKSISQTKPVMINGNTKIGMNEISELRNNDKVSIGSFTFLIEIVPGNISSKHYEILFYDIAGT